MQQTKYFIEGNAAAHAGSIRACRYNKEDNRREWFAGFESVGRDYVVFNVTRAPGGDKINPSDLDPVYVGNLTQCQDRAATLQQSDRTGFYAIYDYVTGQPYQDPHEKI